MEDNLINYELRPQRIGSIIASDIQALMYIAYKKVIKLLPFKNFSFYSELKFRDEDSDHKALVSSSYTSDNAGNWLDHVENK